MVRILGVTKMVKKSGCCGDPQGHSQHPCSAEAETDENCLVGVFISGELRIHSSNQPVGTAFASVFPADLSTARPTVSHPGALR